MRRSILRRPVTELALWCARRAGKTSMIRTSQHPPVARACSLGFARRSSSASRMSLSARKKGKIQGRNEIIIATRPDEIWAILQDSTRLTQWVPMVERTTGARGSVGAVRQCQVRLDGRRGRVTKCCIIFEPPSRSGRVEPSSDDQEQRDGTPDLKFKSAWRLEAGRPSIGRSKTRVCSRRRNHVRRSARSLRLKRSARPDSCCPVTKNNSALPKHAIAAPRGDRR